MVVQEQRGKDLNELAWECHGISRSKGWWDTEPAEPEGVNPALRNFGELLMLVVTEAAEAMESWRAGKEISKLTTDWEAPPTRNANDIADTLGAIVASQDGLFFSDAAGNPWKPVTNEDLAQAGYIQRPGGIPSELADIVIRVLDICGAYGIDIQKAVEAKMAYNQTRPYRHGGKLA